MPSVAVDVGGTFLKGAVFDADGRILAAERTEMPRFIDPRNERREIDGDELAYRVRELFDRLSAVAPPETVAVTGQMAGVAFTDDLGRPYAPIVTWQDLRGRTELMRIRELADDDVASLGDGIRPGSPILALSAMELPPEWRVTSLISFVCGALVGDRVSTIHVTDAASWGMFDLRRRSWSPRATRVAGVRVDSLPLVSDDLVEVGREPRTGAKVLCAVGDQQASLVGAGFGKSDIENRVSINLATGCQVSVLADEFESPAQTRPFVDRRFLHTVTHLPAGRILTTAVIAAFGRHDRDAWMLAEERAAIEPGVQQAVDEVVTGVVDAVGRLGAIGRPALLSGGLVQRFGPLRDAILRRLDVEAEMFEGDDAALAGLGWLVSTGKARPRVNARREPNVSRVSRPTREGRK